MTGTEGTPPQGGAGQAPDVGPALDARAGRRLLVLPSAFTMGNLFFGFWSVVSTFRGETGLAAWLVLLAAVFDWLDGRVAHLSAGDSQFGRELDSLVDLVSFGVAPALLTYSVFLRAEGWAWLICGLFVGAMAVRLARFNVEQAGHAKRYFLGLPSPGGGAYLCTMVLFTTTPLYRDHLAGWPWQVIVPASVVAIAALMVSHVPYAALRPGLQGRAGRVGLAVIVVGIALVIVAPAQTLFPVMAVYVGYGLLKALALGLVDRLGGRETVEAELAREPGDPGP